MFLDYEPPSPTPPDEPRTFVYAVPLSGGSAHILGEVPRFTSDLSLNGEGTRLAYYDSSLGKLTVVDTASGAQIHVSVPSQCGNPSWSNTGLIACGTNDVYAVDTSNGMASRLTYCAEEPLDPPPACGTPLYSPDGSAIAFYRWRLSGDQGHQGAYIIDTRCLANPEACPAATLGPLGDYSQLAWSPDGSTLAAVAGPEIIAYSRTSETWTTLGSVPSVHSVIAWSPDGHWIAHDDGSAISLLDVQTGAETTLHQGWNTWILGWISLGQWANVPVATP